MITKEQEDIIVKRIEDVIEENWFKPIIAVVIELRRFYLKKKELKDRICNIRHGIGFCKDISLDEDVFGCPSARVSGYVRDHESSVMISDRHCDSVTISIDEDDCDIRTKCENAVLMLTGYNKNCNIREMVGNCKVNNAEKIVNVFRSPVIPCGSFVAEMFNECLVTANKTLEDTLKACDEIERHNESILLAEFFGDEEAESRVERD